MFCKKTSRTFCFKSRYAYVESENGSGYSCYERPTKMCKKGEKSNLSETCPTAAAVLQRAVSVEKETCIEAALTLNRIVANPKL